MQKAIAALAGTERDDDAIGVMLLEDIRQIFEDDGSDKLFSENLVKALHALEERPWSEWGQHQRKPMSKTHLAGLLRPFDIRPTTVDIASTKAKGYHKADFADAWERYLVPLPAQPDPRSVTPLQVSNDAGLSASAPLQSRSGVSVTDQSTCNSASKKGCNGVTDRGGKRVTDQNMYTPASK